MGLDATRFGSRRAAENSERQRDATRRGPVSLNVAEGNPKAIIVKEPAVPTVKVVLLPLVMAGRLVDGQR